MSDRSDVTVVNSDVLSRFRPWSGTVPSGYFAYFLGNLTRADYWAFQKETRALYDRERFENFSAPAIDDNILDWLILLEALVEARGEFTMAALGAGWGRWLVAGAFAARQCENLRVRLIGVEAEPTHFQWMLEHFRDNQIDPAEHDLVEAAVSGTSGEAWFYFGKADSWYGQSIIPGDRLAPGIDSQEIEYNGERARRVRTVDLHDLTAKYRRIDYVHMDVQGAELDFLSSRPGILDEKVKRVLVGTHSNAIEEGLRKLFSGLGWHCQYDIPLNGSVRVNDVEFELGDGVQVWINPAL
jgi:FkbM family methyltransferase